MHLKTNISLLPYHTFGIDVRSKYLVEAKTIDELKQILSEQQDQKILILGGGSNVLFTKDYDGLVLKNELKGIEITEENNEAAWVKVASGEVWHELVLWTIKNNFGGLENLSLIPGCVGASPMQNIGAYGVELKDSFVSLEALNLKTLTLETFNHEDCKFGYRESVFKNELKGMYIIVSVTFKLLKNPIIKTSYGAIQDELNKKNITHPTIKEVSDAVIQIRQSKLPDPKVLGNAGSFFKNPVINKIEFENFISKFPNAPHYISGEEYKVPAGWLIEQCAWKGKRIGNTGAHAKQALVLVNYGQATGDEIWNLALEIKKSVFDKFGIRIDAEVNVY